MLSPRPPRAEAYGILRGRVVGWGREADSRTPHFQIVVEAREERWRCPVNVKSRRTTGHPSGSEVLFCIAQRFVHPLTPLLEKLPSGFNPVPESSPEVALDYVRSNLFDPKLMRHLPPDQPGNDNDLQDALELLVRELRHDPAAEVFVFGDEFLDHMPRPEDRQFHTTRGIHNIHMNQGNPRGPFSHDNRVFRDGALLLHFPTRPTQFQWKALFLAFQTQLFHTDDKTGDPLPSAPRGLPPAPPRAPVAHGSPEAEAADVPVRIVAALPYPPPGGTEAVTIVNTLETPVNLTGWSIVDQNGAGEPLAGILKPGEFRTIRFSGTGAALANEGGLISLLDAAGMKVHGVSYTRAGRGRTVTF